MKSTAVLAIAAALASGQVQALSCLRPDPANAFNAAVESTDIYVVLRGNLTFDPAEMPEGVADMAPVDPVPPVPALFEGQALGPDGFTLDYRTELLLQPSCAGPWCGQLAPLDDMLAFARDNGDGIYVIDLDPCGQWVFPDPTQALLDHLSNCLKSGGTCDPM